MRGLGLALQGNCKKALTGSPQAPWGRQNPSCAAAFCATLKFACHGQNGLQLQILLYCQLTQAADCLFGYLERTQTINHLHKHLPYLLSSLNIPVFTTGYNQFVEMPLASHWAAWAVQMTCVGALLLLFGAYWLSCCFGPTQFLCCPFFRAVAAPARATTGCRPWEVPMLHHGWPTGCSPSLRSAHAPFDMKWVSSPLFAGSFNKYTQAEVPCPPLPAHSGGAQQVPPCCRPEPWADQIWLRPAQRVLVPPPPCWNLGPPGHHSTSEATWGCQAWPCLQAEWSAISALWALLHTGAPAHQKPPGALAAHCSLHGGRVLQGLCEETVRVDVRHV